MSDPPAPWASKPSATTRSRAIRRVISGRDFFFGAGIYFTDDDVKTLIGALPLTK